MTDDDEDEASGIPERAERSDSGGHVTESGRHITNRNVVPRSAMPQGERAPEAGEPRDASGEPRGADDSDEAFDDVTPVRPQPHGVFDAAERRHQARDVFEAITPRRTQPRGVFRDDDAAGAASSEAEPDAAEEVAAPVVRTSERWPRLTLDAEGPPAAPEDSAPSMRSRGRRSRPTPEPRRASTEPGHVEPRRRPTTPPPMLRPPLEEAAPDDPSRTPRPPTERGLRGDRDGSEPTPTPATVPIPVPAALDRVLRVVAILAVFGLGAAGLAQPTSVLRGGIAWLAFLFFVLSGWGTLVTRIARTPDPDTGLRAVLGAAGYLAIAGVLVAAGVLTRPVVLALVCLGFAGFAWREVTVPVAIWQRVRDGLVFVRANPALGVFVIVLGLLACVRMLGAVAALDRNPWDDDVAYTPLLKRLLDTGDLVEPFSFRRLGAYGGQTALQALAAVRGTLANVHLIDKGLGLGLALLVMLGHARERRTQAMWLALITLVVLVLPDTAINTASYWTGVAAFLALYRCVVRERWSLAGLLAAATVTLRQNFLVVVALFLAGVLVSRLVTLARTMPLDEAWREERPAW